MPAASVWAQSRRPAGMRMDGGEGSMTAAGAPAGDGRMGDAWGLPVLLLSCSRAVLCLCSARVCEASPRVVRSVGD